MSNWRPRADEAVCLMELSAAFCRARGLLPAHDHLILAYVEAVQAVHAANVERRPWDIHDLTGFVIEKMVIRIELGIEDDFAFGKHEFAEQAFFREQVERVVNGGSRQHRKAALHLGPYLVGRRVVS